MADPILQARKIAKQAEAAARSGAIPFWHLERATEMEETMGGESAHEEGGVLPEVKVDTLSFEDAMARLDGVIEKLERGSVPLEAAIQFYETGMQLAQHCGGLLDATEAKVNQLVQGSDGSMSEVPLSLSQLAPGSSAPQMGAAAGRGGEAEHPGFSPSTQSRTAPPGRDKVTAVTDELFAGHDNESQDPDETIPF